MSYALIDNASLTAVQGALGQIIVKNPDTVNGDLVAFENVVQSILFYDDLVCIDNYKEQYRESRKASFPFIKFLAPGEFDLARVERIAKSEADSIRPEIRGGEFADNDFRALLDLLKLNMVCTWDLRSSVYYLTMKMLGQPNTPEFEKYSTVSSAIFNELSDISETYGRWEQDARLVGSDGIVHTKQAMQRAAEAKQRGLGGTTRALDMFIASLNWLAYKTIYYSIAAKYLKADTFLHPIRHAYQIHWMTKVGAFGHDFTAKLVESLSSDIAKSASEIVDRGRRAAIAFEVPVFSAWLVSQTGDLRAVLPAALELKTSQDFQEIRGALREIRISYDQNGLQEANEGIQKWERHIAKTSGRLKREYGLDAGQGIQGSVLVKAYNLIASLAQLPQFPEFEFHIPLPDFIQNSKARSFAHVYKDVARELTAVERLGGVRDLLAAHFVIDDRDYLPPKTEAPQYRRIASDWKLPM